MSDVHDHGHHGTSDPMMSHTGHAGHAGHTGHHGADLPELGWSELLGTWSPQLGWLVPLVVLAGLYVYGRHRARSHPEGSTVPWWRAACFLAGLALAWVCVASGIGAYAMALAWMHMVLHLTLIMVVPALLVLGHPLTVLLEAFTGARRERVGRVLRSRGLQVVLNSATGVAVYSVVLIGTHLTGFMDQMATSHPLMVGEQVLYVVAGYLFLLPSIGEEPIRSNPSYLWRLGLLVLGMIPDTIVGIVMLQTTTDLYPVYSSMRPEWALDPVRDIQTAGALMWAGGDGGMMFLAIGLAIAVVTSPTRRARMIGEGLERVRGAAMADHVHDAGVTTRGDRLEADSDEALEAYNEMLRRLAEHEKRA